jgi:uncharacterized protein
MIDVIDFDEIDEHGAQDYSGTFAVDASELERHEVSGLGPVSIEIVAGPGNSPGEYVADGSVRFTADFECSRCVDPYPAATTSEIHVRFQPRAVLQAGEEEIELTETGELDVEFYAERHVPLRQLAIEQVQLSIPMKPLCTDGCLGLCSKCGANLNREPCNCENLFVDQRWTALQGIREQLLKKRDA